MLMTIYTPEQSRIRHARPEMYSGRTVARDRSLTILGAGLAAVSVLSKVRRIIMVAAVMSFLVEVMRCEFRKVCLTISHYSLEDDKPI